VAQLRATLHVATQVGERLGVVCRILRRSTAPMSSLRRALANARSS